MSYETLNISVPLLFSVYFFIGLNIKADRRRTTISAICFVFPFWFILGIDYILVTLNTLVIILPFTLLEVKSEWRGYLKQSLVVFYALPAFTSIGLLVDMANSVSV